ncbi:MAG: hypothetical protein ACRDBY_00715 [Cetobacterium sp.]
MSKTIKETKTYYIVKLIGQGKNRYLCMIGHSDHTEWQPCQSSFPKECDKCHLQSCLVNRVCKGKNYILKQIPTSLHYGEFIGCKK